MLIYVIYFISIAILAIQYEFIPFKNNYLLSLIVVLLALLAGFQDISVSKDYNNYQYIFESVYDFTDNNFIYLAAFEPGFIAIIIFFRKLFELNYGVAIMLFHACASLAMKVFTMNRLSINPYLTLLFYFSYFFMLHEMTEIRIGLASAIFFISLIAFLNGNQLIFAGGVFLATCFHYSAIFYLAILMFSTKKFNRNLYISLLVLSVIFGLIKLPLLNLLGNFDPSEISTKLSNYVELSQNGGMVVNVFNYLNILNILCCVYLMYFINKKTLIEDKSLIIFLKCNILSIFLLSFFAGAPAFSIRFSHLFSVTQSFLFTYLVRYLPAKKFNIFILVILAAFIFYITEFYGGLLSPYKIIKIQ